MVQVVELGEGFISFRGFELQLGLGLGLAIGFVLSFFVDVTKGLLTVLSL